MQQIQEQPASISSIQSLEESLQVIRRQRTLWIGWLLAAIGVGIFLYSIFQGTSSDYLLPLGGMMATSIAIAIVNYYLCRRGQASLAAALLFAGLMSSIFLFVYFRPQSGSYVGIILLFLGLLLSTQTFPPRWVNWGLLFSSLAAAGCVLLEIFLPSTPSAVEIQTNAVIAIFIILVILLLWQFRSLGLTSKLVITFLIVAMVAAGLITIFTQFYSRQILSDQIGESLHSLARNTGLQIGDLLNVEVKSLEMLALNEFLQMNVNSTNEAYSDNPAEVQAEISELDAQWTAASASGFLNDPLIQERLQNPVSAELMEYQQKFPENKEIMLTDRYGALVGVTSPTSDYYQADETWWQAAYNNGQGSIYITSPEYDASLEEEVILIVLPMYDKVSREIIGILRSNYVLTAYKDLLAAVSPREGGEVDLYFGGDPMQFLHEGGLGNVSSETAALIQTLENKIFTDVVYEGDSALISQAPVKTISNNPTVSELNWFLLVHQDIDTALAPISRQGQVAIQVAVLSMSALMLFAIPISIFVAGPISRLTQTATQLGEGQLQARSKVETPDEVGILASTLNLFADRLQQTLAGLEQQISERTRELSLAGETGRVLSQMRDLDALLEHSVELIQFSFDLYYVQVYLVNPGGQYLMLRSGTGSVGSELRRRAHRLPIGPGSINGRAANERRPIVVSDALTSPAFRPNPLLPDTRSEAAVPLIVGEHVVGVLDLQSSKPGAFSENNILAFEALASQLAIAIDNARLIAETEATRAEMETQASRLERQYWQDFLDAIHRSEQIGYTYTGEEVLPADQWTDSQERENILSQPIEIVGQPVGAIQIQGSSDRQWTPSQVELVSSIANQVGRQIESLRLLEQAERYRQEAEQTLRQVTRTGWDKFLQGQSSDNLGFIYDHQQVEPLSAEYAAVEASLVQPLLVGQQTIGEIALDSPETLSEEERQFVASIAENLSGHLERLRLSAQTEEALVQTERQAYNLGLLNELARELSLSKDIDAAMTTVCQQAMQILGEQGAAIVLLDPSGQTVTPYVISGAKIFSTKEHLPVQETVVGQVIQSNRLIVLPDDAPMSDYIDTRRLSEAGTQSVVLAPLVVSGEVIGALSVSSLSPTAFGQNERSLMGQMAALVSSTFQNLRLLEDIQGRAQRERTLRQVTQRVRGAMDADTVLRTAVQEMGAVLGRNVLIRLGSSDTTKGDTQV